MDQLSGILLHMDLMDPDGLFPALCLDLDPAVSADGQIQLGDLIVLRVIRDRNNSSGQTCSTA